MMIEKLLRLAADQNALRAPDDELSRLIESVDLDTADDIMQEEDLEWVAAARQEIKKPE